MQGYPCRIHFIFFFLIGGGLQGHGQPEEAELGLLRNPPLHSLCGVVGAILSLLPHSQLQASRVKDQSTGPTHGIRWLLPVSSLDELPSLCSHL